MSFYYNLMNDPTFWWCMIFSADLAAACVIEWRTKRLSTQKATFEILQKLAKKRGYKRIAKQAIQAIQETTVTPEGNTSV